MTSAEPEGGTGGTCPPPAKFEYIYLHIFEYLYHPTETSLCPPPPKILATREHDVLESLLLYEYLVVAVYASDREEWYADIRYDCDGQTTMVMVKIMELPFKCITMDWKCMFVGMVDTGSYRTVLEGHIAVGACGSGRDRDCSGWQHIVKCCKLTARRVCFIITEI